jgi:hypothetical protein
MVTLLKIENLACASLYFDVLEDFRDLHEIDMSDFMLVKESPCTKYEYLYVFLPNHQITDFVKLVKEYDIQLYTDIDFTEDLLEIILTNKLEVFKQQFVLDYNIEFDELIDIFYDQHVTIDMILDKANDLGFESLSKRDYEVLK